MNFLDILLIVPLCYAAWKGFQKGLIIEVFTLLALLVGVYCGIRFSELLTGNLSKEVGERSYLPIVSFTVIFLAVGAMVYFAGKAIEKMVKVAQLSLLNKLAGGFFSFVRMAYILSVLLVIVASYDLDQTFIPEKTRSGSLLYEPVTALSLTTIPALKESAFVRQQEAPDSLSVEQAIRAKELADSLGIKTNDVGELTKIYRSYEKDQVN